jgi:hypothetical protein
MAEAITDTESGMVDPPDIAAGLAEYPMAWSGDGGAKGEIGDLCFDAFQGDHATVAGYAVQKLWSNYAGGCVVGVPVCDGSAQPPACRPCTHWDDGAACSGSEPVCDEASGHCRACRGSECAVGWAADAGAGAGGGAVAVVVTGAGAAAGAAAGSDAGAAYRAGGGGCASAGAAASGLADAAMVVLSVCWMRRRRYPRSTGRPSASHASSPPSRNATGMP